MVGKPSGLAHPAAGAPRNAAASAAAAATAAASATPTAAAASAATATAPRHLNAAADVLLVEEMERRQANVGDFFFTERESLSRRIIRCLRDVRGRHSRC